MISIAHNLLIVLCFALAPASVDQSGHATSKQNGAGSSPAGRATFLKIAIRDSPRSPIERGTPATIYSILWRDVSRWCHASQNVHEALGTKGLGRPATAAAVSSGCPDTLFAASISRFQTALPTMDRAKVRILCFKNLPPFRHYPGLQNHV